MIDYNEPPTRQSLNRVTRSARHDHRASGFRFVDYAVDSNFDFALKHLIHFLLHMEVFVNGCAGVEVIVCEGHI